MLTSACRSGRFGPLKHPLPPQKRSRIEPAATARQQLLQCGCHAHCQDGVGGCLAPFRTVQKAAVFVDEDVGRLHEVVAFHLGAVGGCDSGR